MANLMLALAAVAALLLAASSASAQPDVPGSRISITLYTGFNYTGNAVTFSGNLTSSSRVLKSDDFSKLSLSFNLDNNVRSVRFVAELRTPRLRLYNAPCSGQSVDNSYVEIMPNTSVTGLNATASALVVLLIQNPTYTLRCSVSPSPNPSLSPAPGPEPIQDDITEYCPVGNDLTTPATTPAGYTLLANISRGGTYAWTADASTPEQYFLCSVPTHCTEHGMIFKVTTVPAPDGYTPRTTRIFWRFDNYTDLIVTAGDRIFFNWTGTHDLALYVEPSENYPSSPPSNPQLPPFSPIAACPVPANASNPAVTILSPPASNGTYLYYGNVSQPKLYLFCPVAQHCSAGGMILEITNNPAPPGAVPRTINVTWSFAGFYNGTYGPTGLNVTTVNADGSVTVTPYVSRIELNSLDRLNLTWTSGFHGVAMVPAPSPISPVAACPANSTDPGVSIVSTPRLAGNYTFTANASQPFVYLYCPVGTHCKNGDMIFEVQTSPAPANYSARTFVIDRWRFQQYAPLSLYSGDKVTLFWNASIPHGVGIIRPVSPNGTCPMNNTAPGVVALSTPVVNGTFFYVANASIPSLYLYCPVGTHCKNAGMIFQLSTVRAPPGYVPRTLNITWGFGQYPHLSLVEGDSLVLHWANGQPHGVYAYLPPLNSTNTTNSSTPSGASPSTPMSPAAAPAPPRPPPVTSPVSACPNNTVTTTILAAQSSTGTYNYVANATTPHVYLYCPVGTHCVNGGMIMLVNTVPAPAGYSPRTIPIAWAFGQWPQLDLTAGDTVAFTWTSFHGVSLVPGQ